MNIADPNILNIIAEFINDKKTFGNFSRVSKTTWNIGKKLTNKKKFEYKHIDFEIVQNGHIVNCIWNGQYTKGMRSYKYTKVWVHSCGLEIVYDDEILINKYDPNFKIFYDYEHLLGNFCQLRYPYLKDIIDGLESKNHDVCEVLLHDKNREENIKKLEEDLPYSYYKLNREVRLDDFMKTIIEKEFVIVSDCGYICCIWVIKDLNSVIEELYRVESFCEKNGISQPSSSEDELI